MSDQSNVIIYRTRDGKSEVALFVQNEEVWLTQQQLSDLFATTLQNVSLHIQNILEDKELDENSVIKEYLITATDGKQYVVKHYSLAMILAIGFRVRSSRGVEFRRWANRHLQSYLQKGFVIDSERLKNPNGRVDYFDELLAEIREIRASEMRFYQKVRELFKLASDYDSTDKATQMFFAETQNKLLYAVTKQTSAELICQRANAQLPNMGLTAWKGGEVRKGDVIIAKNYLDKDELDSLNRLVTIFLESAELRVKNRQDIPLSFWRSNVDNLLEFNGFDVLNHKGSCTHKQMENFANTQYDLFHQKRQAEKLKALEMEDLKEIELLEKSFRKH